MNRLIFVLLCALMSAALAGCGPYLRDYVAAANTYQSRVASTTSVSVDIEPNDVVRPTSNRTANILGGVLNVAASVGAAALSMDQTQRLQGLVDPKEVGTLLSGGFDEGFADATHLEIVDGNADLRIFLTVNKYGLWAESLLSAMHFYVEAEIRIVDTASMKEIYASGVSVMREATDVCSEITAMLTSGVQAEVHGSVPYMRRTRVGLDTVDNVANLVSGAASLTAFLQLSDAAIQLIFRYLAFDAGVVIADKLVRAIYR